VLFLRGNAKDSGAGLVDATEPGLAVLRIASGLIVRLCEYFSKRNAKKYPRRLGMLRNVRKPLNFLHEEAQWSGLQILGKFLMIMPTAKPLLGNKRATS
jgi:hypothetical protein